MTIFEATMIVEGLQDFDTEDEMIEAWQLLIDTGTCWKLQGWFGRTAKQLIDEGICHE